MAQSKHKSPRSGNAKRSRGKSQGTRPPGDRRPPALWIYGLHPVLAALANSRRDIHRIVATPNALARLEGAGAALPLAAEDSTPRQLDRLLGGEAVHQGIAIEVAPLEPLTTAALADANLVVVLDQLSDPHNVGAVMRSALAFGADAIVTTRRHAPSETGVLAKAASGALDRLAIVDVPNLARALDDIRDLGFTSIGLDSEAETPIERAMSGERIALVVGAEGKGLRRLTRDTCDVVARLSMPGPLASLNVSNAAVLALYIASRHLESIGTNRAI
jgi:23S rRNA (guanosine2251-2'-O)-methyltransferase